ncbi:MAG: hypothetical protein WC107_03960 [Patescibacteria group bacterium]
MSKPLDKNARIPLNQRSIADLYSIAKTRPSLRANALHEISRQARQNALARSQACWYLNQGLNDLSMQSTWAQIMRIEVELEIQPDPVQCIKLLEVARSHRAFRAVIIGFKAIDQLPEFLLDRFDNAVAQVKATFLEEGTRANPSLMETLCDIRSRLTSTPEGEMVVRG